MSIRHEHGKARPQPPRSKDLPAVIAAPPAPAANERDSAGRFQPGNRAAVGTGFTRAVRHALARSGDSQASQDVARSAGRLYDAVLADLPATPAVVAQTVSAYSTAAALTEWYSSAASIAGHDTEQGIAYLELALKCGARAERLAVTASDLAQRHAARAPSGVLDLDEINERAERETQSRRDRGVV